MDKYEKAANKIDDLFLDEKPIAPSHDAVVNILREHFPEPDPAKGGQEARFRFGWFGRNKYKDLVFYVKAENGGMNISLFDLPDNEESRALMTALADQPKEQAAQDGGEGSLLPCPFCGGAAERIDINAEADPNYGGSYIACSNCLASSKLIFGEKVGLEEAWNNRVGLAAQPKREESTEAGALRIYVASSWKNEEQPGIVHLLRAAGNEVYDFRNPQDEDDGFSWSEVDSDWKNWTPEQYLAGLKHPAAQRGFDLDWRAMEWANVGVLVLPCGKSAHLEAGYFVGARKRLYILMLGQDTPELMYKMATKVCTSEEDLIAALARHPDNPQGEEAQLDGAEAIHRERERQKAVEGWTPEHDDEHDHEELAQAAACYAIPPWFVHIDAARVYRSTLWPKSWSKEWWKPSPNNRKREIEKAGALLAAEWDRLDRAERTSKASR